MSFAKRKVRKDAKAKASAEEVFDGTVTRAEAKFAKELFEVASPKEGLEWKRGLSRFRVSEHLKQQGRKLVEVFMGDEPRRWHAVEDPPKLMRKFRVTFEGEAEILVDDNLLKQCNTDEWRADMMPYTRDEQFAEHIAYNMVINDLPLNSIDGYADQPRMRVKVVSHPHWDMEAEEVCVACGKNAREAGGEPIALTLNGNRPPMHLCAGCAAQKKKPVRQDEP